MTRLPKSKKPEEKNCVTCGRVFQNRKKWSSRGVWEKIRYCSTACQRFKDNQDYKKKYG